MPRKNPTLQDAIDVETARLERACANIAQAVTDERISAHDGDERIARLDQGYATRVARLVRRTRQALENPTAGHVG